MFLSIKMVRVILVPSDQFPKKLLSQCELDYMDRGPRYIDKFQNLDDLLWMFFSLLDLDNLGHEFFQLLGIHYNLRFDGGPM